MDFLYLESPQTANTYTLSDTSNQELDKFAVTPGSAESLLLQYVSSVNQVDRDSSPVCESRLIIHDASTSINKLGFDHRTSLSDMISFRIFSNVPSHVSEDCLCHSCMDTESHNSNTTPSASMCRVWRRYPDDVEASPTSIVVGRVLDFDFDFDFDGKSEPDDLRTLASSTPDLQQDGGESYCSVDQDLESLNQISRTRKDLEDYFVSVKDNVTNIADSTQETPVVISKGLNDKLMKGVKMADPKATYKLARCDDVHGYGEERTNSATKDERKDNDGNECLVETNTNGKNNKKIVKREKKANYIAPLLKTFAKGTTLIGILFLLHLRIRSDRNTSNKSTAKSSQIHWKSSGVGFSRSKGEKGNKIYPVDKFKFGD